MKADPLTLDDPSKSSAMPLLTMSNAHLPPHVMYDPNGQFGMTSFLFLKLFHINQPNWVEEMIDSIAWPNSLFVPSRCAYKIVPHDQVSTAPSFHLPFFFFFHFLLTSLMFISNIQNPCFHLHLCLLPPF
jgi:hypothetical protein